MVVGPIGIFTVPFILSGKYYNPKAESYKNLFTPGELKVLFYELFADLFLIEMTENCEYCTMAEVRQYTFN